MRAASLWKWGRWKPGHAADFSLSRVGQGVKATAASVSHSLVAYEDHVLVVGQVGKRNAQRQSASGWDSYSIPGAASLIAAGNQFSWIGTSEKLHGYGVSARGELATSSPYGENLSITAPFASEIQCGLNHVLLRSDTQLGRSEAGRFDTKLRQVSIPPTQWIRAGGDTSLAFTKDRQLYIWGNTEYSQSGLSGDQLRTPTLCPCEIPIQDARVGGSFLLFHDGTYDLSYAASELWLNGRLDYGTDADAGMVYTSGYGATGHGRNESMSIQPLRQVALPSPASCIGSGLELAAAATKHGLFIWGVVRSNHHVHHLPIPTLVPGSEQLKCVRSIAVGRETILVLDS